MRFARIALAIALVAPFPLLGAAAQDTTAAPASVACTGQIVSAIDIAPQPPGVVGKAPWVLKPVMRVALQQSTTKADVVRPYLQLRVGQPCTEQRRQESERVLRAQPFIADASVRAYPDRGGTVRVEVQTTDEIPVVLGGSIRGGELSSLTVGNGNIAGQGVYAAARWRQGFAYRDGWGIDFEDYHAFGRPYTFGLDVERHPLGSDVSLSLGHRFITNLQRSAWHAGFRDANTYQTLVRSGGDNVALRADRQVFELGGVGRIGLAGKRAFAGALVMRDRFAPASDGVVTTREGLIPDTSGALLDRYSRYRNTRLAAVLGLRLLSYVPARGFDALEGKQDIGRGVQVGVIAGRSLGWFDDTDRDYYFSSDIYGGVGTAHSFVGARVLSEIRRDRTAGRWDSGITSGRLAWYLKRAESRTFIVDGEFSGGWRSRLPFQVSLADWRGGVRGYGDSRAVGAYRLVARAEERWAIGHITSHVGWGGALFADAGKLWAGDVPFGDDIGMKASVGLGLLAAVPAQSQRLFRLDLAVPVTSGAAHRVELRFTAENGARTFWREPGDIARARSGPQTTSIFDWP